LTKKYTIEKVKPLQRITLPWADYKTTKKNYKNKEKPREITTGDHHIIGIFYRQKALLCISLLYLKVEYFGHLLYQNFPKISQQPTLALSSS